MKRALAMLLLICALLGGGAGGLAMYVAWQHNPQGEFYEYSGADAASPKLIHWGYWSLLGLTWFAAVFVPLSLVGTGVIALSHHLDRRRAARND